MTEYKYMTPSYDTVRRTADNADIPRDEQNGDWVAFQKWLDAGGVPEPYVAPPEPEPEPSPEDQVLFNHENRIRELEGQPPLIVEESSTLLKGA